jgi:salicylate hydroxylase
MEALQSTPFGNTEERYGFPYFHIHRADFHKILLGEAVSPTLSAPCINPGPPVEIITGSPVVSVDCENASVTVEGGKTYSADLLVGCDGVRSVVKRFVTGQSDNGVSSGDQAWRFLIPMERVKEHPDLAFATEHAVNNWSVSSW